MENTTVALIIAVVSLVASCIAIGWNIYRDLGDRGAISLDAMIAAELGNGGPVLIVTVTNTGRRSVRVRALAAQRKRKTPGKPQLYIGNDKLPRMVVANDDVNILIRDYS